VPRAGRERGPESLLLLKLLYRLFTARETSRWFWIWLSLFPSTLNRHKPAFYASLYREHALLGGHVIKLGPNNDEAAREALAAWPGTFF
jgi:hypothetical protein